MFAMTKMIVPTTRTGNGMGILGMFILSKLGFLFSYVKKIVRRNDSFHPSRTAARYEDRALSELRRGRFIHAARIMFDTSRLCGCENITSALCLRISS